jgi:hypothetical protein
MYAAGGVTTFLLLVKTATYFSMTNKVSHKVSTLKIVSWLSGAEISKNDPIYKLMHKVGISGEFTLNGGHNHCNINFSLQEIGTYPSSFSVVKDGSTITATCIVGGLKVKVEREDVDSACAQYWPDVFYAALLAC